MKTMRQIHHTRINLEFPAPTRSYTIAIGTPLNQMARLIRDLDLGNRYFIISDGNVAPLYGQKFLRAFNRLPLPADLIVTRSGESSKSRDLKAAIEDRMLRAGADRSSVIIALGGGVIGDLAGFVAATMLRGIPYIHIPTTLLSQVDSSVGGKVAINTTWGKNLIGSFYQPSAVFIDPDTLHTLSEREYRNGLAEVIKTAAVLDRRLFRYLEKHTGGILDRYPRHLKRIISTCCRLKKKVVELDEHESGYRRILNFGHTIGHAVEHESQFRIPHGHAVAVGMCAEANLAVTLKLLKPVERDRLVALIRRYGLPNRLPASLDASRIIRLTRRDKKAAGGVVAYTLLRSIGKGETGIVVPTVRSRDFGL